MARISLLKTILSICLLGSIAFPMDLCAEPSSAAHFIRESSQPLGVERRLLGFIFLDDNDDEQSLQDKIESAADAGFGIIVVVNSLLQKEVRIAQNTGADKFRDLIVINALKLDDSSSRHSLLVLFPETVQERSDISGFAAYLKPGEEIQKNVFESATDWINQNYSANQSHPVLLFLPDSRSSESSMRLIQGYEGLANKQKSLIGFPVIPANLRATDRKLQSTNMKGREFAWDQLLGAYGLDVNSAFSVSSPLGQAGDSSAGQEQRTWLMPSDASSSAVLEALRDGAFHADTGGIIEHIELSVDVVGLQRPAVAGEEIFIPAGKQIQVKLSCRVSPRDLMQNANWLDSLEIVVSSNGERKLLAIPAIHVGETEQTWNLTVSETGMVLRGVARRHNGDNPDFVAFTNPIRIRSQLIESEWTQSSALSLFPWKSLLKYVAGLFLILTTVVIVKSKLRKQKRRRQVSQPSKLLNPKTDLVEVLDTVDWSPPSPAGKVIEPAPVDVLQNEPQVQFLVREHAALTALFATLCVVYGLFVPLNYRPIELDDAFDKFSNIQYLNIGLQGRQDWVANLLLFIPLGYFYCGSLILDRRSVIASRIIGVVITGTLLTVLAVSTEFFQLWFPPRTVSQNDVIAETIGGWVGSLLAVISFQKIVNWTRRLISKATLDAIIDWVFVLYVAALLFVFLVPFDFVLSIEELKAKSSMGRITTNLVPQSQQEWISFFVTIMLYVPVGFWTKRVIKSRSRTGSVSSVLLGLMVVVVYELLQLPVFARASSVYSLVAGATGVCIGVVTFHQCLSLFKKFIAIKPGMNTRRSVVTISLSLAYLFCIAYFYKGNSVRGTDGETMLRLQQFWQVPFARLYWGSELNAFFFVVRQVLLLLPIGFLLADSAIHIGRHQGITKRLFVVLVFISVTAALLEVSQAWSEQNFADVTDALLLTFGGIVGVAWRVIILDFIQFGLSSQVGRLVTIRSLLPWMFIGVLSVTTTGYSSLYVVRISSNFSLEPENRVQLVIDDVATTSSLRVENVLIPTPDYGEAVWGATGNDSEGNIWIGVSDGRHQRASARILKIEPANGRLSEVSNVLSEIRKHKLFTNEMSQSKIHSKFIVADDGLLYFTSMDEQGEKSDGSQLPTWGSHLWRIHPQTLKTEHLAAVPEGLIAISGGGRWIYALGLFDHVLYQWDTHESKLHKKIVGAIGGHISRTFVSDTRGHVFVPRLTYYGKPDESPGAPLVNLKNISVELVQFDTNLLEVTSFPLEHYLTGSQWTNHGIVGTCSLENGSVLFTTSAGRLYRIFSSMSEQKSSLQDLGWFHPDGNTYAPSLFELSPSVVGGVVHLNGEFEWVEYNLANYSSTSTPFPLPASLKGPEGLLLYGSQSKDQFGSFYLVGKKHETPIALRVSRIPSF